jgi:ATP-dependent Lon protease
MKKQNKLPVVFVRGLVVYPGMSVTLTVGREASRLAVRASQEQFQNSLVILTQLRAEDEEIKDLGAVYRLGTICKIEKVVALTDGGMQVQIEGLGRFTTDSLEWQGGVGLVQGESLPDSEPVCESDSQELLESLSTEGVCDELPKLVEVDRKAVISEYGLKVGREENSIERTVDEDLLELEANPSVKFGGTAPSSVV